MKHFAHLNTAVQVIGQYKGAQPFGVFLKEFFRKDKKYGSKDRKNIGHLCYCYFRLGKAWASLPVEQRIVAGLFVCSAVPNEMLAQLHPAWNECTTKDMAEKMQLVAKSSPETGTQPTPIQSVFPWPHLLSPAIDPAAFAASFLVQPLLFLRLRPGKQGIVKSKLMAAAIEFTEVSATCLSMPNASKVDEVIAINKEAVIQDFNSQQVGNFLPENTKSGLKVWDCCAASGGKSILATDKLGNISLTVSDVRESIIANLRKRFAEAGITKYQSFVADISDAHAPLPFNPSPDLIIADVPCSGSGTWSRTPEQLFYFNTSTIEHYSTLQKKITGRVVPLLKPGGYLLYITCSAFREENEEVIAFLQQQFALEVVNVEVLKGYDQQADTMFAALLRKPNV